MPNLPRAPQIKTLVKECELSGGARDGEKILIHDEIQRLILIGDDIDRDGSRVFETYNRDRESKHQFRKV